jgi:uncharacterized protein YndB with AHSA1/START domain
VAVIAVHPRLDRVRSRGYDLVSDWVIDAPAARVWDVLADPGLTWPLWWPGMRTRSVSVPRAAVVGSSGELEVRPWRYGYRLRLGLRVESADSPRHALLRASGDLAGTADVTLTDRAPTGTHVHTEWRVVTCRPWMNLTADVLGPAFAAQHRRTMAAGEAGLRAYLAHGRDDRGPATGESA